MEPELIVSPEELFFLGKMVKAKYIDYAYISMMEDVGQARALAAQKAQRRLEEAGYMSESFSGDVEIKPEIRALLEPLFFGEFESTVTLCETGEKVQRVARIHSNKDGSVLCVRREDMLHISRLTDDALAAMIVSILPAGYLDRDFEKSLIKAEKLDRIIALKNDYAGEKAEVKIFVESNGWIFYETKEGLAPVTGEYFFSEAYRILKES